MLAHKHRLSRRHAYEMTSRIHTFYEPYFNGRTVGTVTRQDLKAFALLPGGECQNANRRGTAFHRLYQQDSQGGYCCSGMGRKGAAYSRESGGGIYLLFRGK
jgi:hypothetical protein